MADKRKRDRSDKEKTFTIIISIVVALVLWAYVLGEVNPTTQQTISNVPVQLLNTQSLTARELAIAGSGDYTVNVLVEGKRADIMSVTAQDLTAEADLFGWSKGENYIPVTVSVPETLKVIEVKSAKIQVTIEDLVAVSKPVEVEFRGTLPADTEEGAIEVKPSAIEITGARSEVESVIRVLVTVDYSGFSADGSSVQAAASALNYAAMPVENVKLSANYVQVNARLLRVKEVPLVVELSGELGEGLGAELSVPETIKIKGARGILEEIQSVSAEPVDVTGVTGDGTVAVNVLLPDGVELAKGYENIQAGVSIQKVSTRTFTYAADEVGLDGLTQGQSIGMQVDAVDVTVTGRAEVVEAMTRDDLRLTIDATDLPPGVQTVKITTSYDISLHRVILTPEEITIELIDTEQEQ